MYRIKKGKILALASNADVYGRGERYFKEGKVLDLDVHNDGDLDVVDVEVMGNYKRYKVRVSIDPSGEIKTVACDCNAFGIWRGICKHIVAALLCLSAESSRLTMKENNLRVSREINRIFEKQLYEDVNDHRIQSHMSGEKISLRPTLSIQSGYESGASLEFTVGLERHYIVKNLSVFIEGLRKGEVLRYGKSFEFRHVPEAFDSFSREMISLIKWHDNLSQQFFRTKVSMFNIPMGRSLSLFPQKLDEFFDICENKTIPISVNGSEPMSMKFTREHFDLKFHLSEKEGTLRLDGNGQRLIYLKSDKYFYILWGQQFHKVEKPLGNALIPLQKAMTDTSPPELYFEGEERVKFISYVLPKLKKFDLLDIDPEASLLLEALEPVKSLYFDTSKGYIHCKPLFRYGDREVNLILEPPDKGSALKEQDFVRDLGSEMRLKNAMLNEGFNENPKTGTYVMKDDGDIFNLYLSGLEHLKSYADVYVTDAFKNQFPSRKRTTKIGVRLSEDLLALNITSDFSVNELIEALTSFNDKKKYHRLRNGTFINLMDEDIKAVEEVISGMELTQKDIKEEEIILPKFRALNLERLAGENSEAEFSANQQFENLVQGFKGFKEKEYKPPERLEGILRNYQKIGFGWLRMLADAGFGGVLADDMGLGKTIQMISVLLYEKEKGDGGISLVVTPTSLVYNWKREIERFAPELSVAVISGEQRKRREDLKTESLPDVMITTYDLLKRDLESYQGMRFKYIVADEAQYIKNPGTQNAKALKSVSGQIKFALTGTPMENSLSELWSIFDFVMPGYLHSHHRFVKNYETPIVKNGDTKRAQELKRQTAPFILRRMKREVLPELPDKVETTLYAEMPTEQRRIYTANLLMARGELDAAIDSGEYQRNRIAVLASITRLRQICCHPGLFAEDYHGGSGKLELALETIDSALHSGHRMLLFSQFTSMLSILRKRLDQKGIKYFYLDGSTPSIDRAEMSEAFNGGECGIFLISLKAGGTGLNLTGADIVLHYDPWWNPAVMDQATDRAHRIGQENIVQVINLVAKDSIEEKILELQSRKKDLIDSVIVENGGFLSKMTQEEMRELFQ